MLSNSFNLRGLGVLLFFAANLAGGCKTFTKVQDKGERITVLPASDFDSSTYYIYAPYKTVMEKEMRKQVAVLGDDLTLDKPESTLGTLVVKVLNWEIKKSFGRDPDFCFYNYGGIRTPSLTKGPLYVEDAYRLLPFDNMPVMLEITGKTVSEIFQTMASNGGWPISGASYHIQKGKATNVLIKGQPLDTNQTYTVGTIDFLAQGGDNMSYLTIYTPQSCEILMRDAMLEYWKFQSDSGREIAAETSKNIMLDE